MNPTDLYPYLIIIGSSILIASARLIMQYRKQLQRSQELIRLNEDLGYDLPDFLRQCWPCLKEAGFIGIYWNLDWFGTNVAEEKGELEGGTIERRFAVQEIELTIRLYQNRTGWKVNHFNNTMSDNFFLLVRMNLWIKLGTIQGAFDQTAKMSVFLKHDVKNMVQLMSLSVDQLRKTSSGQEQYLVETLKETLPAVLDRAQHMLDALGSPRATKRDKGDYSQPLEQVLQKTASIYELPVKVSGEALVNIEPDRLQSIIDNLFGNYSQQSRKNGRRTTDLQIKLEHNSKSLIMRLFDQNGDPCLWPERLFEPFWSEYGTGRGIGLYQAKQQAAALGGDLTVQANPDRPLCFILSLPLNA